MSPHTDPNRLPEPLLIELEACEFLRIRPRQLYAWRKQGLIPFVRISRSVRYRRGELEAALDAMSVRGSVACAGHSRNPSIQGRHSLGGRLDYRRGGLNNGNSDPFSGKLRRRGRFGVGTLVLWKENRRNHPRERPRHGDSDAGEPVLRGRGRGIRPRNERTDPPSGCRQNGPINRPHQKAPGLLRIRGDFAAFKETQDQSHNEHEHPRDDAALVVGAKRELVDKL